MRQGSAPSWQVIQKEIITAQHSHAPDGLSVSRLTSPASSAFDELLALYRGAFPPEERKPSATLRTMLGRPDYQFWTSQRDGRVLALAIVHTSTTHPLALLEYLAVHPGLRGRGIGRHLLQHVLPALHREGRSVLIEAESDKVAAPGQASRTGRKRFYRSLGAREVAGLAYRMPAVSVGTPPPMDLLVYPAAPTSTLAKATLHAWLTAIYVEVYNQSHADPRLTDMLSALPDPVALL